MSRVWDPRLLFVFSVLYFSPLAFAVDKNKCSEVLTEPRIASHARQLTYKTETRTLNVEILNDKLVHFELSAAGKEVTPFYTTPYIDSRGQTFSGPRRFEQHEHGFETSALKVDIDPETLEVSIYDKFKKTFLTKVSPVNLDQDWKGLEIAKGQMTDVYGLGQQFLSERIADPNSNWINHVRTPGSIDGNAMTPFHGGYTGNTQFPIMYALGPGKTNYAIFLDQVYKQEWNFQGDPWKVETWGDQIRWYFIAGEDLPALRTTYMNLVGKPLVPPKKAFGLWVSEYGFESWDDIYDKLRTLRENGFPIDGFVMDLQWFGGVNSTETTPMGTLRFDESRFPNPAENIRKLREEFGIGLMAIEESYVGSGLSEHQQLEDRGFLARETPDSTKAFYVDENPWWGLGGMIDWTNVDAGSYWHDWKRQDLVDLGIMGHWTDLGEPEMYRNRSNPTATPYYYGFPELGDKNTHADVQNILNLKWHESIYDGYERNNVTQRPWILARSGGPGMQRYGAGMWSGDIGSNFGSLATHLNVQTHMSLSGVDYFGSDIGGFHRSGLDLEPGTDLNELFTQWFANGSAFDVPVRPHTENLARSKHTAPDRIGNLASNLANIRLRYELSPYYYSLAHRAYLYGEPVVPPLVYYYQDAPSDRTDMNVRTIGHEKLIGRDLLVAVVAGSGEKARDIYLPPGEWIDFYSNARYQSSGQTLSQYPEYHDGIFRLPMFVKAGAIIPKMFVDEKTMNIEGDRTDGTVRNELIARVYSGAENQSYEFTLYEDDGQSNSYKKQAVATTKIKQFLRAGSLTVTVERARGSYEGMATSRNNVIEFAVPQSQFAEDMGVRLNGKELQRFQSKSDFLQADSGYFVDLIKNVVYAKSGVLPVTEVKHFTLR